MPTNCKFGFGLASCCAEFQVRQRCFNLEILSLSLPHRLLEQVCELNQIDLAPLTPRPT